MNKKLFVVFIFLVILSAFFLLDFKAAKSETQANSRVSSVSTGDPVIDLSGEIFLYVEGDALLADFVRTELKEGLEERGMSVLEVRDFEEQYSSQALLVNVREIDGIYTPFYASQAPNILFFYSSTGSDVEYFKKHKDGSRTINFTNRDKNEGEKLVFGELELQDSTKGIVSKKAYQKHLAAEISKEIAESLFHNINPFP